MVFREADPFWARIFAGGRRAVDRLAMGMALTHAKHVYRRFLHDAAHARNVQERVLLQKIARNADSDYGRDHHFERIHDYEQFVRNVPVQEYEQLAPYVDQVWNGRTQAMFGGSQGVRMFALTSGSTDQPKRIPVTDAFLNDYRRGWNAFGVKALMDHPEAILRPIGQVVSRMDESYSPCGVPCGAITGLLAATQKRLVRRYYVVPQDCAYIEDSEARYYAIARFAVARDIAFIITASPATQMKLAKTLTVHAESLIRDVHDGVLRADLRIAPPIREKLHSRLGPQPSHARRLQAILDRHGALLPKHVWRLAFLANWTAGTMGLYLREFPHYFGDTPVRDIGLLASEGRVSLPVEDGSPAGILDVRSNFYEFVPADEADVLSARTLRIHELEPGRDYYVLLTTSAGFYRYHIGDCVRVHGFHGQAPVVEFLHRGLHTSSVAGEKLTESQVLEAYRRTAACFEWLPDNFVLAPYWDDPPFYVLHVGWPVDCRAAPTALCAQLDDHLQRINAEYASKRHTDRLGPIALNPLPPGFLTELDEQLSRMRRPGNEQYKHRYLYRNAQDAASFPGFDAVRAVVRSA